jgi:peptidyl-prolyl isomerase G (cyclophilin G)
MLLEKEEGKHPKENGEQRSNGIEAGARSDRSEDRQPDVVDDHPGKSRSTFHSCHTSVILYAYRLFKIWYFIKS